MLKNRLFDANNLADELGALRSEIKQLTDVAKGIEALIKAGGDGVTDGDMFHATVTTTDRKSVDWQTIAKHFGPSYQLVAGNTKWKETTTLRLSAHKKA
mgnify:CR=1 FL=1